MLTGAGPADIVLPPTEPIVIWTESDAEPIA